MRPLRGGLRRRKRRLSGVRVRRRLAGDDVGVSGAAAGRRRASGAWGLTSGRSVAPALARPWQNLLFAGLATAAAGLYYRGIVDIAGVDGGWERWFLAGGGALTLAGTLGLWRIKPEGSC